MLDSVFGETGGAVVQFILALIIVLALILLVAWLIKRLGGRRFGATQMGKVELEIVDAIVIDQKRRLVLVRHGKLEHLLLIGGGSDEVVERSMINGIPLAARMQARRGPTTDAAAVQAPTVAKPPQPEAPAPLRELEERELEASTERRTYAQFEDEQQTPPNQPKQMIGGAAVVAAAAGTAGLASAALANQADNTTAALKSALADTPIQNERDAIARSLDEALHNSLLGEQDDEPVNDDHAAQSEAGNVPSSAVGSSPVFGMPAAAQILDPIDQHAEAEPTAGAIESVESVEAMERDTELERQLQSAFEQAEMDAQTQMDSNAQAPHIQQPSEPEPDQTIADYAEPEPTLEPASTEEPVFPVQLSARPDPVPVIIPSRGPAASAASLPQADSRIETDDTIEPVEDESAQSSAETTQGEEPLIDLSDLIDTPEGPEEDDKSNDLDEEMRRLLGEIAGGSKSD